MKKTLSTMAAAAVLMASTAIAPAFAQSNSATPATPNTQTDTGAMPKAGAPAGGAMTNDSAASGTNAMPNNTAAASGEYLTQQSETQISANDYIGKPIYNSENNSIGDVNDLILEQNGGIVAAVVGVGGFLGIGEKDVAVPMSKITMSREDNNNVRLTTTETADSLKAAPEFKTLDDQQAEARSNSTDTTTTSSTGGAAPAGNATTPSTQAKP
ncbi:PRC-barrel domain-containing protein [Rhizobium helianthi]|uniref:PRC-barrel domain-containing protein n=1 Tax=Rhizobium helianthi TaxID=1132695 RepID=A0ABW4M6J9_9HYPH